MPSTHLPDEERRARRAAYEREWRRKNPDRAKQYKREYRQKHRDRINAQEKERYYRDVDLTRARKLLWRKGRKEEARARLKAVLDANPNYYRDKTRKSRKANRAWWHHYSVKSSAKKRKVEFSLTVEWFRERLDAGVCEMTGLPFDMKTKRGRNTPSVDRRDPTGPYSPDNCRMVLWSLNHALSNHGEAYMIDLFRRIIARIDAVES